MATHPILHFGTSLFGSANSPLLASQDHCSTLLDDVHAAGISQIDTAARYPPENSGASERMLGAVGAATDKGFRINTKVLFAGHDSDGTLALDAVRESVRVSRERLLGQAGEEKKKKLGILYAHCPDGKTPLEEQVRAMSEQVEKGYCEQIGLSNFPPALVEEWIAICDRNNYIKPTVYQGQYNLVCLDPEATLLPLLRKHSISYNAFSPLGGGFLTGNLTAGKAEGTRLAQPWAKVFRNWYDRPELHDAMRKLVEVTQPLGLEVREVALRWLAWHSELKEGDGIILGGTKGETVAENVRAIKRGRLPEEVLDVIGEIQGELRAGGKGFEVDKEMLKLKK